MNIQALMKQAQNLQKDMLKVKEEINNTDFTAENSLVKVTVSGDKVIKKIEIDKNSDLTKEDIEMLEDMVLLAVNEAFSKVDKVMEEKMGKFGNAIPSFF